MSTDILNIDKIKKSIKNFQNNNFNVTKFLKSVVTKHIYMIIYLFVSAFVLYGCKIYGPFPLKNNANLFGHSFTFINPTFYQKNTQTITNIPIFMKNQMYDTYNYTMYALVFFFQSLFNINNDYIIAIIGPVLLCIYLSFLTIFGCIIFIYCYIVNLFFNFSSSASLFMRIVLIHFFSVLFVILFLFIPIIQLVVIILPIIQGLQVVILWISLWISLSVHLLQVPLRSINLYQSISILRLLVEVLQEHLRCCSIRYRL